MPTIRLIPSAYTRSSTSRVTVTNEANMYNNTDHTGSYATIRGRNNSSNIYYVFIHGFNFGDVPTDAIVNSFSVKIKAYRSSNLSTSNLPKLASTPSNNSVISDTTLSSPFTTDTSGAIYTFPNGSLTWSQLAGYGTGFSIEITLLSTSNQYPYAYIYGAEILVDYTLPVQYNISVTNNSSTVLVAPTGMHTVYEGDEFSVTISNVSSLNNIEVKDNGNDVKSQLVFHPSGQGTETFHLSSLDEATGTIYNNSSFDNVIGKASSNTSTSYQTGYTRMTTDTTMKHMIYNFDCSSIPQNAVITNLTCTIRAATSNGSVSHIQLYSGNEPMGQAYTTPTSSAATFSLVCGTWSREELNNIKLYYEGRTTGSTSSIRIWGVDLVITYTSSEHYSYTISNISTDHTIVISDVQSNKMYTKVNGGWVQLQKAYKKVNNLWVEQSNFSSLFSGGTLYVRG